MNDLEHHHGGGETTNSTAQRGATVSAPEAPTPSARAGNPLSDPQEQPVAAAALESSAVVPLRTDKRDVPTTTDGPPTLSPLALNLSPFERLVLRQLARYLMFGGIAYAIISLLWNNVSSLIPFIVGLVLAYVAMPLVNMLNKRMPRWAAILVVYAITFVLIVAAIFYIVPPLINQIREIVADLPNFGALQELGVRYLNQFRNYVPASLQQPLDDGIARVVNTLRTNITAYASRIGTVVLNTALQVLDTVIFIIGFLVVPFWLFYVLNDADAGLKAVDRLLPSAIRDDFWALMRIIDGVFSKYIRGQLILGAVVGTLSGIGLFVLNLLGFKVNYVLVLAIIAGATELIPVIGPIIGAVPAVLLGLFDGPSTALAVVVLYIVIQQVENQVLVPRITGEAVGIHPALMFVILAVASQAFGLIGAILCAPVFAAIRDIVVYLDRRLSNPLVTAATLQATSTTNAPGPSVPTMPPSKDN